MRKCFLFSAFIFITALWGCNKSENKPGAQQPGIQGKWNIQKEYDHQFYTGYDTYDTIIGEAGDYFDFRDDGKAYYKAGTEKDTSIYTLFGSDKIITASIDPDIHTTDTILIQSFTDNSMQLYSRSYDPYPEYSEYTIYLTK